MITNISLNDLFNITVFSDENGSVLKNNYYYHDVFSCQECIFENKYFSFIDNKYILINAGINKNYPDDEIIEINKLTLNPDFSFFSEEVFDENLLVYFHNPFIDVINNTYSLNTIKGCSNLKQASILKLDNFQYFIE